MLTVSLLGVPVVISNQGELRDFSYDKVRALLFYLVAEADRTHQRDVLAELLWPDLPPQTARVNLRQALRALRQALHDAEADPPYLLSERATLRFNPQSAASVDLWEFSAHVTAVQRHHPNHDRLCPACVGLLERAAELYRGDFLAHFILAHNIPFNEWVAEQAERLQRAALAVVTQLMRHYLSQSAWKTAQQYAFRVLALEPWEEQAQRCLMQLLAQQGQRSAALQQYARCVEILQATFGLEPEAETVALAEGIRAGTVGPAQESAAPPHEPAGAADPVPPQSGPLHLPVASTALIGRERALADLLALVSAPTVRLVTINGTGGIGKSRLSAEVARAFQPYAPDGVWFVPLASVSAPQHVASTIAHALGIASVPGEPLEATLVSWLAPKAGLLVLDNFEQVVEARDLIARLLDRAPQLKLLITSRILLKLYGEWEFPLAPLSVPAAGADISLEAVLHSEAAQLFVARARASNARFAVAPDQAPALAAICRRLDGLPLALELAAARTKLLSLPQLSARLNRSLEFLVNGPQNLPARHQTLRATIDWGYQLLEPHEQQLFARLGVFAGSWDLLAASAVMAPGAGDLAPEVLQGVEALLTHSMIQQHAANAPEARFSLLETLREYALEQLEARGAAEAARAAHAAYYLELAEQAQPALAGADAGATLDALELDIDNLRAALAWQVARGDGAAALRFCAALWPFWRLRGYQSEGCQWVEQALALPSAAHSAARVSVLMAAGWMAHDQGDYPAARRCFEQGLVIAEALADDASIAGALQGLGEMAKRARDYQGATEYFTRSLELYQRLENDEGVAWAFDHLGLIAYAEGQHQRAAQLLARSLAAFRALQHRWGIGVALLHAGMNDLQQQRFDQAQRCFEESRDVFEALGNTLMLAWPLALLGRVALYSGVAGARQRLEHALELFRQLGNNVEIAKNLAYLGRALLYEGAHEQAIAVSHESLRMGPEPRDPEWGALALSTLGWATLARRDASMAYDHFAESLRLRTAQHEARGIAECLVGFAALLLQQGRAPEQAAALFGASGALQTASSLQLWCSDRALAGRERARLERLLDPRALSDALQRGAQLAAQEAADAALTWARPDDLS